MNIVTPRENVIKALLEKKYPLLDTPEYMRWWSQIDPLYVSDKDYFSKKKTS